MSARAARRLLALALSATLALAGQEAVLAGTFKKAQDAARRGDCGAAVGALEEYAARFPHDPRPWKLLEGCYAQTVQPLKTQGAIENGERAEREAIEILTLLRLPEDVSLYREWVAEEPEDPLARLFLAIALFQRREVAETERLLGELNPKGLSPRQRMAMHNLRGLITLGRKEYGDAKREFVAASGIVPGNPVAARQLRGLKQMLEAEAVALQAPDDKIAAQRLAAEAENQLRARRFERALDLYQKAVALDLTDKAIAEGLARAKAKAEEARLAAAAAPAAVAPAAVAPAAVAPA
ncbi:MAG: hypothetical protein FJZ01_05415, partial [Candidatus Sericytochromatia bacterium]|nr:hypothetical protein [Candidatus Tanganyikabacteria bacterium]